MPRTVSISCFHEHLPALEDGAAIVAVDVIRATTTAVTAAARGRRCFTVPSIEAAVPLAARLDDPLLAGELGGSQPYGFHMQNSPTAIEQHADDGRPVILLSTSGTRLMWEAGERGVAYAACLRNHSAQANRLAARHERVLLLGADSRGEFRDEDQLCCARIGAKLVAAGYAVVDAATEHVLEHWAGAPDDAFLDGRSAEYLRATEQQADLHFILAHVDDLEAVFALEAGEVVMRPAP